MASHQPPAAPARARPPSTSRIRLTVVGAQKLAGGWLNLNLRLPDVFCEIECGSQKWTTETSFKTVNPLWRWVHDVEITRTDSIIISLWNAKKVNHGKKKGFMGCVRIIPSAISSLKDTGFQRLDLQKLNEDDQDVRGVIIISLLSKDPHSISRHQNNVVIQQQQESNLRPINMIQCVPSTTHGNNTGSGSGENASCNALPTRSSRSSKGGDREERSTGTTRERSHFERNARSSSARIPKVDRRPLNASHGNSTSNPQINVVDGQVNCSNRNGVSTSSSSVHNNIVNSNNNSINNNNNDDMSSHNNDNTGSQNNHSSSRNNDEVPRGNISMNQSAEASHLNDSLGGSGGGGGTPTSSSNTRRSSRGHRSAHSSRNSHNIVPTSSTTSNLLRPQLPEGYEICTTEHGQIYYYHTPSDTTTYYDPRVPKQVTDLNLDLDNLFGKLPDGWEKRTTPSSSNSSNRTYFLNHMTRTTQFTDPRLILNCTRLEEILNESGINGLLNRCKVQPVRQCTPPVNSSNRTLKPPMPLPETDLNSSNHKQQPIKKNLIAKMQAFKQAIQPLQITNGHCRLEVSRKDIFEDSFTFIMKMKTKELRKKLMVKFRGEEGIDYGGVAREWLHLLSREMLNPQYALFKYTADHIFTLQINPDSGINSNHLSYFQFVGRILGIALFHGHHIGCSFTLPFYKMLLGKPVTLEDIRSVDPEFYNGMQWVLKNTVNGLDMTFSVDHNRFGEIQVLDLKENGREIAVTDENKEEYIRLYVNYRYKSGIEKQFNFLLRGFNDVVPSEYIQQFDENELEIMISGVDEIDLNDWKAHTRLKHCTQDSTIVKWFWKAVESYSEEKRARLLQFVTGSPRVPLQGFKALQGTTGAADPRLFTINLVADSSTNNLPQAHTCFNRIDLPPYDTFEKLLDKLTQAIDETDGFALD